MSVDFRLDDKEAQQLLTILWTRDCGPAAIVQPIIQKLTKQMQHSALEQRVDDAAMKHKGNNDEREISARPKGR